jgi:hypothetical protein
MTLNANFIITNQFLTSKYSSQEDGSPSQEVPSGLGIFKMAAIAMETVNICQNL